MGTEAVARLAKDSVVHRQLAKTVAWLCTLSQRGRLPATLVEFSNGLTRVAAIDATIGVWKAVFRLAQHASSGDYSQLTVATRRYLPAVVSVMHKVNTTASRNATHSHEFEALVLNPPLCHPPPNTITNQRAKAERAGQRLIVSDPAMQAKVFAKVDEDWKEKVQ